MQFPAHIRMETGGKAVVQDVRQHCRNTADNAAECLKSIGLGEPAYLAGLMHDMGKFRGKFREYIEASARGEDAARGSVIHTFQGCRYMLEKFHGAKSEDFRDVTSELIAYAVGAHHGLFDCVNSEKKSAFDHRKESADTDFTETVENFTECCASEAEIKELFVKAHEELSKVYDMINGLTEQTENGYEEACFYSGLLVRLVLSSVIEGDRRDTAEFMLNTPSAFVKATPALWEEKLRYAEKKLAEFPCETPIECARDKISRQCRLSAEKPPGVYRLNVPTGGGKTLSSLRFALRHAQLYGKKRIIFTSPLLSILEQNAAVLRKFIGDDGIILEHHSNVIKTEDDTERENPYNLLTESWDSPVIITTLVQLLNTMFDGRTSSIRRFNALVDSIVIIDEVQTVPMKLLTLFNLTVNFLSKICKTTFVLCSATQPELGSTAHPMIIDENTLVPHDDRLWKVFSRTRIIPSGAKSLAEIAGFAMELMDRTESLLVVCNTKLQAEQLYKMLCTADINCFHLSAAMCAEHRRQTLKAVKSALREKKTTVCVSTQVIEAGVDISFECVIRLAAGMDSVVQSAGRCNRNGEQGGLSDVYVVLCADENLKNLSEIEFGRNAALQLIEEYKKLPERFNGDLTSDEAVSRYYNLLYRLYEGERKGYEDYSVLCDGYKTSLFTLLGENENYRLNDERYFLNQSFAAAGRLFEVFDKSATDVIVPYCEGKRIIDELGKVNIKYDIEKIKELTAEAKQYTVSLYRWQLDKLRQQGGLAEKCGGAIFVLKEGYYDEMTGFTTEQKMMNFMEV